MSRKISNTEKYEFEIGKEGLNYDILDSSYNPTTQAFALKSGLKSGMKILDIGCGAGVMTAWLAKQAGPDGLVTAIDNSPEQLAVTQERIRRENIKNVQTKVLSAYEIDTLNTKYDLIYSRFLLHHLHSPRKAIQAYYDSLAEGGKYIGEEGIMSLAFAYPPTFAWQGYSPELKQPEEEQEGQGRDGDIGMKLFYACKRAGFSILDCGIIQPVLWKKEQKIMLLEGLKAFKKTDLEQGTTEQEWQNKWDETQRFSEDENQIIGFYGSFQIAAIK